MTLEDMILNNIYKLLQQITLRLLMTTPFFYRQPKGFLLRLLVLLLARNKPVHGYEIMKQVEQLTGGEWVPAHSMIYKLLESLKKEGYLTRQKDYKGEVERRLYTITDKGTTLLKEAVTNMTRLMSTMVTLQRPPPAFLLPQLLLQEVPPNERRVLLTQMRDAMRAHLAEIEEELAKL
jgi:DNA-binding PadR family transcriptional regulator